MKDLRCTFCGGSGVVVDAWKHEKETCMECHGTGSRTEQLLLETMRRSLNKALIIDMRQYVEN